MKLLRPGFLLASSNEHKSILRDAAALVIGLCELERELLDFRHLVHCSEVLSRRGDAFERDWQHHATLEFHRS